MKIAIMQPYFLPYIGYWQLIKAVDKFVIYDNVKYIKKGFINRNKILLLNGKIYRFTIPLQKASQNKNINELCIYKDEKIFNRILKTIRLNYSKAPYFKDVYPIIVEIFNYNDLLLSEFIRNSISRVLDYLKIEKKILIASKIIKDNKVKGEEKIIKICKILNADFYINPIGGINLYNKKRFKENGIALFFLKTIEEKVRYRQFNNIFVPKLSIIDVLMHNSKEKVKEMLDYFELL